MGWRALLLCVLAAALAVALPSAGGGASAGTARAFVVGDSLAQGTAPYLPQYLRGWRLQQRYSVGFHLADGVAAVRSRSDSLPPYLVVSLGTNDDPRLVSGFRAGVAAIVATAGTDRCVVWPNIVRPPAVGTTYAEYNRVLRLEAASHRNLHIVDWAALLRAHPAWVRSDGVHASAAGYRARAAAIAAALEHC